MPTVELSDGEVVVFRDGQLIRARATHVEVTHNEFTGMALLRMEANVDTIQCNQLPERHSAPSRWPSLNSNNAAFPSTVQSVVPAGRLLVTYMAELAGGIAGHIPRQSRLYVFPDQPVAFVYRVSAYRATNISADYVRQNFIHGEYFNGPPDNRGPGENWFAAYNNGDDERAHDPWVTVQGSRCYVPRESLIRDNSWYAVPAIERPAPVVPRAWFSRTTLPDGWNSVSNSGQDNAQRLSQSGALPEAFRQALEIQHRQRVDVEVAAEAFLSPNLVPVPTESAGQINQPVGITNTTSVATGTGTVRRVDGRVVMGGPGSVTVSNNISMINAWGPPLGWPPPVPLPPEPKYTPIPISDDRPRRLLLND